MSPCTYSVRDATSGKIEKCPRYDVAVCSLKHCPLGLW
jgi:hypothetical protein